MKLFYSTLMLAVLGFIMKPVPPGKRGIFDTREMREVNRRLDSIGHL